jgi:TadE-like protein
MGANMSPSRGSGKNRGLTFESDGADRKRMDSKWAAKSAPRGVLRSRERGQALVEFALIAPLFLVLVVGIIQFGIGLNYWLDLNRIANQGARWAVVNHGWKTPTPPYTCQKDALPSYCMATGHKLQDYLESEPVSGGLTPDSYVCFPTGSKAVGQPVQVWMATDFTFLPILDLGTIKLKAKAEMRIEQAPSRYLEDGPTCP